MASWSRYIVGVGAISWLVVVAPGVNSLGAQSQAQPDVFLASLRLGPSIVAVGSPRNVTRHAAYDNQPSFAPDGGSIYFTSTRLQQQADIYRFVIASGRTLRVTATAPESEYSAFVIPRSTDLAVIRVERDSTQRLWRVPVPKSGSVARELGSPLVPMVKPAGYFAFADSVTVALFVLGTPPSLQLVHRATGRVDTVVTRVGRSLHRHPRTGLITFVSKAYEENWWVMSLDPATKAMLPIAKLPKGVEDYAWLSDGRLVVGDGPRLFVADPAGDVSWKQVADFSPKISGITRLAVSPSGGSIAFVGIPARP